MRWWGGWHLTRDRAGEVEGLDGGILEKAQGLHVQQLEVGGLGWVGVSGWVGRGMGRVERGVGGANGGTSGGAERANDMASTILGTSEPWSDPGPGPDPAPDPDPDPRAWSGSGGSHVILLAIFIDISGSGGTVTDNVV